MRLDLYLVERAHVASREKAKELIHSGLVLVNDIPVKKPSKMVTTADIITVLEEFKYVGRAGYKLEAAIRHYALDLSDKIVIDIGCSTGGFTSCALQEGARKVLAVDIGDPLHPTLREDPRVVYFPYTDARTLAELPETPDIALIDVTFASLPEILTQVRGWLHPDGIVIALVKPPYEVEGRARKITGDAACREIVDHVIAWSQNHGFRARGYFESPLLGKSAGQREYLLMLQS